MTNSGARILLSLLAALSGCTSLITATNSAQVVQQSATSSESTFRTILPVLRECFPISTSIESNYFPEAREGEITIAAVVDGMLRMEMAKMTIVPTGSGSTVTMRRKDDLPRLDAALAQWVVGKDGGCPYGSRVEPAYPSHNPYGAAASK